MSIPDGWELRFTNGSVLSGRQLTYSPGTSATIENATGGQDGYFEFFARSQQGDAVCADAQVTKDDMLEFAGRNAILCTHDSTSTKQYRISHPNGNHLSFSFATLSVDGTSSIETPERTELIEAILNTIQFK